MLIIGTAVLGRHGIEAQQTTKEQPQDLVIEIPESATEGTITIYTPDGAQLVYFGKIHIINDGKNGSQINISLDGWLVGKYLDGVAEYTE